MQNTNVTSRPSCHRKEDYHLWLSWFAVFALVWTTFLVYAGGFTTSVDAGMAFLDWPLSNGSINPDGWLEQEDQMAEHGHRILAIKVGLCCTILMLWCYWQESRKWVVRLSLLIFMMVVLQGALGGLRVLLDKQNLGIDHNTYALIFRVAHGCFAQIFLCALVALVVVLSKAWISEGMGWTRPVPKRLRVMGIVACGLLASQLFIGAIMRHGRFSLIIPTYPEASPDGGWLPYAWNWQIVIQFLHTRIFPLLITFVLVVFFLGYLRAGNRLLKMRGYALAGLVLLAVQITLGILTVVHLLNKHAATLHVLCGAFLLATTFALLFSTFHPQGNLGNTKEMESE
jgi:cytochrome c oxidase assembly protein subunit 15